MEAAKSRTHTGMACLLGMSLLASVVGVEAQGLRHEAANTDRFNSSATRLDFRLRQQNMELRALLQDREAQLKSLKAEVRELTAADEIRRTSAGIYPLFLSSP